MKSNISTTQSYLNQTDSTLTSVSNLLTSIQSTALSAVGTTASPAQRQAVIQQIQQAVQALVTQGNQQIAGPAALRRKRHLHAAVFHRRQPATWFTLAAVRRRRLIST